MYNKFNPKKK